MESVLNTPPALYPNPDQQLARNKRKTSGKQAENKRKKTGKSERKKRRKPPGKIVLGMFFDGCVGMEGERSDAVQRGWREVGIGPVRPYP